MFSSMANLFSTKVTKLLERSKDEATRLASKCVGPEHLLLALLTDAEGTVCSTLNKMNINIETLKSQVVEKITSKGQFEPMSKTAVVLDMDANNILKLAVNEAKQRNEPVVNDYHIMLALLHYDNNPEVRDLLTQNNIQYDALSAEFKPQPITSPLVSIMGLRDEDDDDDDVLDADNKSVGGSQTATKKRSTSSKTPVLDNFSTDLTQAAAEGMLDPVVGREHEISRITEILCRRKKNNPVLIGEPGVGKSAIVEGLAQMIADRKTSPMLFNKRVVNLDLSLVVAGTKYRGQFEERIQKIIGELEQNPDIIVFMDEIHTMIGAGNSSGSMDAANMLKPALARGKVQCIGATTLDEYRKTIEKDGALERRFQKVIVEQTSREETLQILHNIADRYEHHHHVRYTEEALKACVDYTERYISDRQFPDKAIDALDEVGSKVHLKSTNFSPEILELQKNLKETEELKKQAVSEQKFELAASYRDKQVNLETALNEKQKEWEEAEGNSNYTEVTEADVAEVVSLMSGVPVQRIAESESKRLKEMTSRLTDKVIGQDKAIEKMVRAIQRNRIGLRDPNHPIGVFMFIGPTGVGKTHLAKQLALDMFGSADALIRIDMSEYTESFNTSRLVGAPPGYVGYEEGGQLTERVRRHPYSIVLLDEIEKAHGNVYNMLLQVMDEGRLTDGNGRLIDFRNTIIIMTSNAGTKEVKDFGNGIGFNTPTPNTEGWDETIRSVLLKALSKKFAPEFLNRLDEIVTFDQLQLDSIKQIIDLELKGLYQRVENLGYQLVITDEVKTKVAEKGYDIQYGARPLKRAIQTYIEDQVCQRLLEANLQSGQEITIAEI